MVDIGASWSMPPQTLPTPGQVRPRKVGQVDAVAPCVREPSTLPFARQRWQSGQDMFKFSAEELKIFRLCCVRNLETCSVCRPAYFDRVCPVAPEFGRQLEPDFDQTWASLVDISHAWPSLCQDRQCSPKPATPPDLTHTRTDRPRHLVILRAKPVHQYH